MQVVKFSLFKLSLILSLSCGYLFIQNSAIAAVPDEVQAIFDANCRSCHNDGNQSGTLSLEDAQTSEDELVNMVANCSNNNELLVDPGEPNNSILYLKLQPNPNCGGVMPQPPAALLSAADLNVIFDWIVSIGPAAQFGLIQMEQTAVTVPETDTSVTLTVNREIGSMGAVTVDYTVSSLGADNAEDETAGSTEDPSDYVAAAGTLTFADGETSQTIVVVLTDDDVFEGTEVFSVTLSNPGGGAVLGGAVQTKVTITDNEFDNQPGTFFFERANYDVSEADGSLDITVNRSFGAAGQIMLDVNSTDGSALSGGDYQTVSSTLVFEEGIRNQTFTITIVDDAIEEQGESFTLSLSQPSDGDLLGGAQTTTVNISDDDAANANPPPPPPPASDPTPEEEAEYEAAGSLIYLLLIAGIVGFIRLKKRRK